MASLPVVILSVLVLVFLSDFSFASSDVIIHEGMIEASNSSCTNKTQGLPQCHRIGDDRSSCSFSTLKSSSNESLEWVSRRHKYESSGVTLEGDVGLESKGHNAGDFHYFFADMTNPNIPIGSRGHIVGNISDDHMDSVCITFSYATDSTGPGEAPSIRVLNKKVDGSKTTQALIGTIGNNTRGQWEEINLNGCIWKDSEIIIEIEKTSSLPSVAGITDLRLTHSTQPCSSDGKYNGLPSCHFNKDTWCGYYMYGSSDDLLWRRGKEIHSDAQGDGIERDAPLRPQKPPGYFAFMDVSADEAKIGSKATLQGDIFTNKTSSVSITIDYATTGPQEQTIKIYNKIERGNNTARYFLGQVTDKTHGRWKTASFFFKVVPQQPGQISFIAFEGEKLDNQSYIALDNIGITGRRLYAITTTTVTTTATTSPTTTPRIKPTAITTQPPPTVRPQPTTTTKSTPPAIITTATPKPTTATTQPPPTIIPQPTTTTKSTPPAIITTATPKPTTATTQPPPTIIPQPTTTTKSTPPAIITTATPKPTTATTQPPPTIIPQPTTTTKSTPPAIITTATPKPTTATTQPPPTIIPQPTTTTKSTPPAIITTATPKPTTATTQPQTTTTTKLNTTTTQPTTTRTQPTTSTTNLTTTTTTQKPNTTTPPTQPFPNTNKNTNYAIESLESTNSNRTHTKPTIPTPVSSTSSTTPPKTPPTTLDCQIDSSLLSPCPPGKMTSLCCLNFEPIIRPKHYAISWILGNLNEEQDSELYFDEIQTTNDKNTTAVQPVINLGNTRLDYPTVLSFDYRHRNNFKLLVVAYTHKEGSLRRNSIILVDVPTQDVTAKGGVRGGTQWTHTDIRFGQNTIIDKIKFEAISNTPEGTIASCVRCIRIRNMTIGSENRNVTTTKTKRCHHPQWDLSTGIPIDIKTYWIVLIVLSSIGVIVCLVCAGVIFLNRSRDKATERHTEEEKGDGKGVGRRRGRRIPEEREKEAKMEGRRYTNETYANILFKWEEKLNNGCGENYYEVLA